MLPFLVHGAIVMGRKGYAALFMALAALNFILPAGHVVAAAYFPITPEWVPVHLPGHSLGSKPGPWLEMNE